MAQRLPNACNQLSPTLQRVVQRFPSKFPPMCLVAPLLAFVDYLADDHRADPAVLHCGRLVPATTTI